MSRSLTGTSPPARPARSRRGCSRRGGRRTRQQKACGGRGQEVVRRHFQSTEFSILSSPSWGSQAPGGQRRAREPGGADGTCLVDLVLRGGRKPLCQSGLQDLGHIPHPIPGDKVGVRCGPTVPARAQCTRLLPPYLPRRGAPAPCSPRPAPCHPSGQYPAPTKLVCRLWAGPRALAVPLSGVPWKHHRARNLACHPPQRPLQHVPWAPCPRTAWEAWRRQSPWAGSSGGWKQDLRGSRDQRRGSGPASAVNQQLVQLPSLRLCATTPPRPCSGKRTRASLPSV